MSSSCSLSCPTTPAKKMAAQGSNTEYDECRSPVTSPLALSSPGGTVDDSPFPATPSSLSNPTLARSPTRRRGKTISTIPDVSLMNHAIFSLTLGTPITTQSRGDNVTVPGGPRCHESVHPSPENEGKLSESETHGTAAAGMTMEKPTNFAGDESKPSGLQFTSYETGPKDLAKHGVPSACVFVANLAASQTDDQLMKSLQAHFGKFGRLYVKIRRDLKGNPYSFCQFENDSAARLAVREGRNAIIDSTDRRIRCEPAKVNRTLILSRHDNASFDETEARKILFGFGETESLEFAADMASLPLRGLKEGKRCFIRFVYRQDAVDCYQYFRFHGTWTAEWTNNVSTPNFVPRVQAAEIDPLSLFVGRLNPSRVTEEDLRERFGKYGTVIECNLLNRTSKSGVGRNAFAFIKYELEESATMAMENENNSQFLGTMIQVQKREMHKRTVRNGTNSTARYGSGRVGEPVSLDEMDQGFTSPSFCFSLKDVASLAAHLSLQFANKQDQNRRQSVASIASNTTAYDSMNYSLPPDSLSARRGSYRSVGTSGAPGLMFHQPFQTPYGINSGLPVTAVTPETPLSPRTAQATVPPPETHAEDAFKSESATSGTYNSSGHQYHNQGYFGVNFLHQNTHNDPYCGAFPPPHQHPQFSPPNNLVQHFNPIMGLSQRRDSVASIGYDAAPVYSGFAA